ncbi:hypothetical protein FRB98_007204 [Tulasnella sp. 332]|nr:hypothetical protein FRB98_007204 [Tulasnella sp. 332]
MIRKSPPPGSQGTLIKRARPASPSNEQQVIISTSGNEKEQGLIRTVTRTSGLDAPIVSLAGAHGGEILCCRFDPTGQFIAACSADRTVSLWRTYPPNTNYGQLTNVHKAPILDLQWSLSSSSIYTAGADGNLCISDLTTGTRIRRIKAHQGVVNSLDRIATGGTELLVTGGDDGAVRVWDVGANGQGEDAREPVKEFEIGCPVTAVCWSSDAAQIYVAALDNCIHTYDLRTEERLHTLKGHTDTPASLVISPGLGNYILSPSFSSQTLIHDIRPFSPHPHRIYRQLQGAPAGFENTLARGAWSKYDGGRRVAVGGADRSVTVWDVESGRILYKLPGHKGTVTCVEFHPKEPIVLTGSKDGTMLLGEIDPSL